ncbi:MAG: homocysteine S-methyltransferase family protein [Planctomycetia bacterium]|nr:homocysteine S-methyltransferase family protein [Planctomycetia bacterium]
MDERISQWLADGPLVIDGGWGTQLQLRGLPLGMQPDLWNLENPEAVSAVARAYVEAGSDIILSNTFGANRFVLAQCGAAERVHDINLAGAKVSREAADAATGRTVRVFASMGPSGKLLMTGEVSEEELFDAFKEQANAIAQAGVDAFVVETMSDPQEAALAIRAAKTTGRPVVGSMTFDSGKNKDRTMMGTTIEQAVKALTAAGADAVGANCGQGIDGFIPLCQRFRAATELPLWMKGNAGLPEMRDGQTVYSQTPEAFAEKAKLLLDEGASFIGGCCGTTPDYIRELRKLLPVRAR